MDAAAAAAAADTLSGSPIDADPAASAAAAARHEGNEQLGRRKALSTATGGLDHTAAEPGSTSAAGTDPVLLSAAAGAVERAGDAAAAPQPHVATMVAGSSTSRRQQRLPQLPVNQQRQQQLVARPGSPTAQPPANIAQLVPRQPSEPGPVPQGSVDLLVDPLSLVFSMDGSQSQALWEMSMGVLSGNSSMRCSISDVSTLCPMGHALHEDENPQQEPAAASAAAGGTARAQPPAAAMVAADAAGVAGAEGAVRDLARVSGGSAASSGSRAPSAFATSGGIAAAAAAALDRSSTGYRSSGSSISLSRPSMHSSSVRAAATAAAARAEEEGINLPNGLWLQQSQSLKGGAVTAALQLLGQGVTAAGAEDAVGLEGAGSGRLLPAGSSRTLSGPLSPALTQSASLAAAGQVLLSSPAAAGAAAATDSSVCIGAGYGADMQVLGPGDGAGEAAGNDTYSITHPTLCPTHARNVSMMSWLPGAEALAAGAAAGAPAADDAARSTLGQSMLEPQQQTSLTSSGSGASDGKAQQVPGALQAAAAGTSRAVTVPFGAVAGRSQRKIPSQPWLSPARYGSSSSTVSKQKRTSSDGAVLQLAAVHGPSGTAAAAASGDGGASALEHAPSAAASSVEQEFYVGSFWSPGGLAAQAGVRRQQLQHGASGHLARSTSSLGHLDSLQDSGLLVGATSTALELDDATSALQPPGGSSTHTPAHAGAGPAAGQMGSSSGTRSGFGTRGEYRVSTEGLMEGCLPADSESQWEGGGPVSPRQAHGTVFVRVQSGLAGPTLEASCTVPAVAQQVTYLAAAKECVAGDPAKGSSTGIPELPGTTGDGVLAGGTFSNAVINAASGTAALPGKYSWLAKEVVSRSQQQREHQPWFDAFDEPSSGGWYFPGT